MNIIDKFKGIEINFFQTIALTGIVTSLVANAGLLLAEKSVNQFWMVYLVWVMVFIASSFIKAEDPHDHHH